MVSMEMQMSVLHTFDSILSAPNSYHPCCLKNCRPRWLPPTAIVCSQQGKSVQQIVQEVSACTDEQVQT